MITNVRAREFYRRVHIGKFPDKELTMLEDPLTHFLVSLPSELEFKVPENRDTLQAVIFRALYYSITDEGYFISDLFPDISESEIAELEYDKIPFNNRVLHLKSSETDYTHPQGTACGRTLYRGEPVYRCIDCATDPTCVLCLHCFDEDSHVGHNIEMYIASNSNSGICDCGDPEAYPATVGCKCQKFDTSYRPLDARFSSAIRKTIKTVLDYILDVIDSSVSTLPFIHDNVNKSHTFLHSELLSHQATLPLEKYGIEPNSNDIWHLVLWNDEFHNFPQAIGAISSATGFDQNRSKELAMKINKDGRCILRTASSPVELFRPLDQAETGGLVASIISARDYMREEIIDMMFRWLEEVLEYTSIPAFSESVKTLFAQILMEPNYKFYNSIPTTVLDDLSINAERRCFENGLTYNRKIVNNGLTRIKSDFSTVDLLKPVHQILEPSKDEFFHSRLQYLFIYSIRFKSSVRKRLSEIIMAPLLVDSNIKYQFCQHYIQIYPNLITSFALTDREEHLTVMIHLCSQIINSPMCVHYILENDLIGNIVGPLSQLIEERAAKWNYDSGYPNFHELTSIDLIKRKSLFEAISAGLHDVSHITDRRLAGDKVLNLLKKNNLAMMMLLFRNYQGYWPIERKYGDHIEREVLDYVIHIRYSVPVLKIAKEVAEATTQENEIVASAAKLVIHFLMLRKLTYKEPGVAEFKVSREQVSFVNPINSFLSYLIQRNNFSAFDELFRGLNRPFMQISDISLRSIVLGAQVKIGFWIRNGLSVSRQASCYNDSIMFDSAYRRDMHLNQIALLYDDPRTTLLNFLDRWELLDWYNGDVTHDKTVYEDRFSSIAEKFVLFIYNLIVDRTPFLDVTLEEREEMIIKRAIGYALCSGPATYTDVRREVEEIISDDTKFEEWFMQCTEYQPPTGYMAPGMYRLKDNLFETLDPYSAYLDSSKSQDVAEKVIKHIAKRSKKKEDTIVLHPRIDFSHNLFIDSRITEVTNTKSFTKFLYKLLQTAIDTSDETYLPQLLHLLHVIVYDYQEKNQSTTVPQAYIDIPISDLLLNIIESAMSRGVVNKANCILDIFIKSDPSVKESLIDCFGEEHISAFFKNKSSHVETDSEKKKKLALKRNAKVMKKFEKQRSKFLTKNIDLNIQMQNTEQGTIIGRRNCVLCGESESKNELFGLLGSALKSPVLWKLPETDQVNLQAAFAGYDEKVDTFKNSIYGRGYKYHTKESFNSHHYEAFVATSCTHGMHYKCFQEFSRNNHSVTCPLCHTAQNIFIPSFLPPSSGGGIDSKVLNADRVHDKYNQLLYSNTGDKCENLLQSMLSEELIEESRLQLKKNLVPFQNTDFITPLKGNYIPGRSRTVYYFNFLMKLCTLIADTIRVNEISSRINGAEGYTDFLTSIPGSTKTLLKSLVQCRAILFELREMGQFSGSNLDFQEQIQTFWDSNYLLDGAFTEVVVLFFQTNESFRALAHMGWVKVVTLTFLSILFRSDKKSFASAIQKLKGKNPDAQVIKDMFSIMRNRKKGAEYKDVDMEKIYEAMEICVLPFLKQLIIFKDILTSRNEGDNNHVSTLDLQDLPNAIRKQEDIRSTNALCLNLGIPTLRELITSLVTPDTFEYRMRDVLFNAKLSKYLDQGIFTVDFPGVIKLIDLPHDYTYCLIDANNKTKSGSYDNYVCLHCGSKLPVSDFHKHMRKCCSQTALFFQPAKNRIRAVITFGVGPVSVVIPGPYLSVHGEVATGTRGSGKAFLSESRYKELTKQWLDMSLFALITRTFFGSRPNIEIPLDFVGNNPFNIGAEYDDGDDEDDSSYDEDNMDEDDDGAIHFDPGMDIDSLGADYDAEISDDALVDLYDALEYPHEHDNETSDENDVEGGSDDPEASDDGDLFDALENAL